jgi:CHAT domain-containing protein/predicted negative regulator of RcsB-dependent stress response
VSLRKYLVLALLTFLLVMTIKPSLAENPFNLSSIASIQSPITQLEQAQQSYHAGRLTEAVQLWQQAVERFRQQGDSSNQAASYNYLAIVYQDLGQWEAAQTALTQALKLLQRSDDALLQAQILNTQGSLQLNLGQPQAALETWKQATECYRALKDVTGIVLSQINQAQALQALGLYRSAKNTLLLVNQDLAALPESLLKVRELRSLGVTLQIVGDLQQSQAVLSESLVLAKGLNSVGEVGETAFSLGNTARAIGDFQQAIALYQQAAETASNSLTRLEAKLNQLSLWLKMDQKALALTLLPKIKADLVNLTPSRGSIYAQVNFAESLSKLSLANNLKDNEVRLMDIAQILVKAVQQARELKDPRAQSYALGQFGHLYEQTQQWEQALTLTNQAVVLAQEIRATDIAATWHWQQGRILKAQGKVKNAIAAYDQAVNTLRSLRQDLVAVNPDVQFSFREQVEPVYRQFVQLLLQDVDSLPEATKQQHLQQSRATIEALQLAELENFFREACLTYKAKPIEEIDASAAVIYPIILDQRLEVILSLPGQPLKHYGTELAPEESTRVSNQLRQYLNPIFQPTDVLPAAQKVYDWLLRPAQADLESQNIKTLVFVLDGFLRRLPLAVLHDGKQYLLERYNLALNPGLQLLESRVGTQTDSQALSFKQFKTLAVGLTEARQGFSALPGVRAEIKQVVEKTSAQVLLDRNFTRLSFQKKVDNIPFSVVHLATHGQFSSKAEDTFLLTWDSRINVKDLDQLLRGQGESSTLRNRQPIELLVLSACQTAQGDSRAALGLAGVAIRSGARSTLATLWSVDDQSTAQLMTEFYRLLIQGNLTKAEALRQAQLSLLKSVNYRHPYYWAPFVLVGNWR